MGSVGERSKTRSLRVSSALRLEVLDQHPWDSGDELASAIFVWIECCYNAIRRYSCCEMLSPVGCETTTAA
jgi:hypothetical protein